MGFLSESTHYTMRATEDLNAPEAWKGGTVGSGGL